MRCPTRRRLLPHAYPAGTIKHPPSVPHRCIEQRGPSTLRHLDLAISPPAADDPAGRARFWELLLRALRAVAPTLETFHLAWLGEMVVGDWMAPLQARGRGRG